METVGIYKIYGMEIEDTWPEGTARELANYLGEEFPQVEFQVIWNVTGCGSGLHYFGDDLTEEDNLSFEIKNAEEHFLGMR